MTNMYNMSQTFKIQLEISNIKVINTLKILKKKKKIKKRINYSKRVTRKNDITGGYRSYLWKE